MFLLNMHFQVDQGIAVEVAGFAGKDVPIVPAGKGWTRIRNWMTSEIR